jgi:phospholipase C
MYNAFCSVEWPQGCSSETYSGAIPYAGQTEENSLVFEDGYRGVRGYLTEGRYLVFVSNGYALTNPGTTNKQFTTTPAAVPYDSISQRWVIHTLLPEGTTFNITSAVDGKYISQHSSLSTSVSGAEVYNITNVGSSQYILQKENGAYLNIKSDGSISFDFTPIPYSIYSVTYHS